MLLRELELQLASSFKLDASQKEVPCTVQCSTATVITALITVAFLHEELHVGRWGGFETLEKWVTGAFVGHTVVCLKDDMGNLWVGESGHENEKGEEIIAIIPWHEWWASALKDSSNPQIALLPLHPEIRAKINSTAAWEYARSMYGKPYVYHNMIFSWID
ncbi:hypothetical protein RIF29_10398 [Crotalaria pallida]|uniref:Uncharacterized protein n=1 Tax=Crotalaria pallida TaxID=3830 RepID=A0AAN9FVZ1_CROPI